METCIAVGAQGCSPLDVQFKFQVEVTHSQLSVCPRDVIWFLFREGKFKIDYKCFKNDLNDGCYTEKESMISTAITWELSGNDL